MFFLNLFTRKVKVTVILCCLDGSYYKGVRYYSAIPRVGERIAISNHKDLNNSFDPYVLLVLTTLERNETTVTKIVHDSNDGPFVFAELDEIKIPKHSFDLKLFNK